MKTRQELLVENRALRRRVAELEAALSNKSGMELGMGQHVIQQLIDALPTPVYVKDKTSTYRYCNRAFAEFLRLPLNKIIGCGMHDTSPPALARLYMKQDRALLRHGGVQVYETEVEALSDGTCRTIEFHKTLFKGSDGKTAGIVGVAFDVTERKTLKEKEAQFAAARSAVEVVAALPEAVFLADPDGTVTSVNPSYAAITGRTVRGMRGNKIQELIKRLFIAEDADTMREFITKLLAGRTVMPQVALFKAKGKTPVPVLVSGAAVRGRAGFRIITCKDISELVRARDEAMVKDRRFRNLFDTSHDAIVITGRDGTFVEVNDAFLKLVGIRSRKQLSAFKADDFFAKPQERLKMRRSVEKRGFATDYEFRMRRRNGDLLDTQHTITVRYDKSGRIQGYQGIIRDVTEKKKMEAALREAEKNQMMAGITGFVTSLEARDAYTKGHSEAVAEIVTAMAAMTGVDGEELDMISIGAMLHDIGKIGVRDSVLLKPGRLTDREYSHIKKHPQLGAKILKSIPHLLPVIDIVKSHHERMDGKGYPMGLKGKKIPLFARMTAVADTYHALTSDRPYRKGMALGKALAIITEVRGTQLCPDSVDLFLQWVGEGRPRR